jgi:hypothetical protein
MGTSCRSRRPGPRGAFTASSHSDLRGSDLSPVDPTTTELDDAVIGTDQAITLAEVTGLRVRNRTRKYLTAAAGLTWQP